MAKVFRCVAKSVYHMTVIFSIEIFEKWEQENFLAPTTYYLPIFSFCFLFCFPLRKLPLPLLALEKRLYLREQDMGEGSHLMAARG